MSENVGCCGGVFPKKNQYQRKNIGISIGQIVIGPEFHNQFIPVFYFYMSHSGRDPFAELALWFSIKMCLNLKDFMQFFFKQTPTTLDFLDHFYNHIQTFFASSLSITNKETVVHSLTYSVFPSQSFSDRELFVV